MLENNLQQLNKAACQMSSCSACVERMHLLTQSSGGRVGLQRQPPGPVGMTHFQGHTQLRVLARAMLTLALPTLPLMLTGWSYPCPPLKPPAITPIHNRLHFGRPVVDHQWERDGRTEGSSVGLGEGKKMLQVLCNCPPPITCFICFPLKSPGGLG